MRVWEVCLCGRLGTVACLSAPPLSLYEGVGGVSMWASGYSCLFKCPPPSVCMRVWEVCLCGRLGTVACLSAPPSVCMRMWEVCLCGRLGTVACLSAPPPSVCMRVWEVCLCGRLGTVTCLSDPPSVCMRVWEVCLCGRLGTVTCLSDPPSVCMRVWEVCLCGRLGTVTCLSDPPSVCMRVCEVCLCGRLGKVACLSDPPPPLSLYEGVGGVSMWASGYSCLFKCPPPSVCMRVWEVCLCGRLGTVTCLSDPPPRQYEGCVGVVCLYDGVVCLYDGVVCLCDGVVCLCDGVVCLCDGVVCLYAGSYTCMHNICRSRPEGTPSLCIDPTLCIHVLITITYRSRRAVRMMDCWMNRCPPPSPQPHERQPSIRGGQAGTQGQDHQATFN